MQIEPPRPVDTTPLLDEQPVGPLPGQPKRIAWTRRRRSLAASWRTFRRSKVGMTGLFILLFFIIVALITPLVTDHSQLAVTATIDNPILAPPSSQYPFGTDNFGRSVLLLTMWGSRISLLVGLAATVITMVIGAVIGIAAGYFGRSIDTMLNAFTNWFLVIPWIALAIAMAAVLGPSLFNIILVIAVTSWAATARIVRAQTLSVRHRDYVERARALGAGDWHLVTRHILPNVFPIIFANTILTVALAILSETTLSLLGLGDPTRVSWGGVLDNAFSNGAISIGAWWWLLFPGLGITLVVLGFALSGYAIDEIINPRLRRR